MCVASFPSLSIDDGGYNWMAPSLQSLDPSSQFSVGVSGNPPTQDQSSLLFKRPTKKMSRPQGPNFGKERLRPDGSSASQGKVVYGMLEGRARLF